MKRLENSGWKIWECYSLKWTHCNYLWSSNT